MINSLNSQNAAEVARLHLKKLGLSPALIDMAATAYQALLASPLAVVNVVEEDGAVTGFILATTDRQRLISDLFSRCPMQLAKSFIVNPAGTRKLIKLFHSPLKRPNATAEILCLSLAPQASPALAAELIEKTLSELNKRGAEEVFTCCDTTSELMQKALSMSDFTSAQDESSDSQKVWQRQLPPCPDYMPGPFTFTDRLRCAFRFELLVVFPIYCLALIPFASFLAYQGTRLDAKLGLPPILPEPLNYIAMVLFILGGGLLLVYSYSFLILEGEGGPVPPFSAKTRRLVTIGPYTYVRHPSIIAKLIGVTGLGLGFNSWVFLLFIIPLLLTWSIIWNGSRQDTDLVKVFGEEYLTYQRNVPMLFPRLWKRKQ